MFFLKAFCVGNGVGIAFRGWRVFQWRKETNDENTPWSISPFFFLPCPGNQRADLFGTAAPRCQERVGTRTLDQKKQMDVLYFVWKCLEPETSTLKWLFQLDDFHQIITSRLTTRRVDDFFPLVCFGLDFWRSDLFWRKKIHGHFLMLFAPLKKTTFGPEGSGSAVVMQAWPIFIQDEVCRSLPGKHRISRVF